MLSRSLLIALSALGYLSQGSSAENDRNSQARGLEIRDTDHPTTLTTSIKAAVTASSEPIYDTGVGFWPAYTPVKGQKVKFGDSLNITWGYDPRWDGTLNITLIGGATQNTQTPLGVIAENIENKQTYNVWDVTNDFVGKHEVYGLSVLYQDGKTQQYSMPFQVV